MTKVKMYLDNFMESLKSENPNASWTNLLTGLGILVLVSVFSIWYFGNSEVSLFSSENVNENSEVTDLDSLDLDDSNANEGVKEVIVEQSEGLWQIAERVCGDGELYNEIAVENKIELWAPLHVGQKLTVSCIDTDNIQVNEANPILTE